MSLNPLVRQKLKAWKDSPLMFAIEAIQVKPSTQQIEYLKAVPKSKRITIRSGHGTGKDASTAWVILWFLCTRPYAKVACTAPTARQLQDILWSEISKWLRQSVLTEEFIIQRDKIFHKEAPKEWWCRAISVSAKSSKEEQAETLAGLHGDHLLIVVDEASGVPDPVFIPLEGALTQQDNKVVLIGNMTRASGYFYDSHFHSTINKDWFKLHWNSEESSNVDDSFPTYMANKYGRDSDVYRIRVLGEPPLESAETLIPLSWAMQCVGNEIEVNEDEPLYVSVDVARYGDDASIVLPRRGPVILPWSTHRGINTINLAGYALQDYQEMEAEGMAIDEIGVGAGVVDFLEKKQVPGLYGVNVANKASQPEKYYRLRDELWLTMREKCMKAQYSFPTVKKDGDVLSMGEELANELASVTYEFALNGSFKIESKKDMKSRGLASPNIADALGISEYFYNVATRVWPRKQSARKSKRNKKIYPGDHKSSQSNHSWMAV